MFRFFRTTRKRLLGDRNVGRYLLYAVGEILLVVIGILIGQDAREQRDSLKIITGNLMDYSDFDRTGNIYETIVNSGDVRLIKNDEINNRLRRLEETYLYINRMEAIHDDVMMQMAPALAATINFASRKVADEEIETENN